LKKVVLVGSPNVGKSVIFNYLTGKYVTVSNYPGTTVEIARGRSTIQGTTYEVIDTPGIYSLLPITEEEKVTRHLLCQEKADIIIHVIDGKNIRRMLQLTLQLLDAGFPVLLNINLMDEATKSGVYIETMMLATVLGIPVVGTAAVKKIGLEHLKREISRYCQVTPSFKMLFSADIEQTIVKISNQLQDDYGISRRMTALLLLQGDRLIYQLTYREPFISNIIIEVEKVVGSYSYHIEYILTVQRQAAIDQICNGIVMNRRASKQGVLEQLGRLTREPATGIPILCIVLFLGLYEFVGKFGAGFLVDFIDVAIFTHYITPVVENIVYTYISLEWLQSLLVGNFGIYSLGFRYAFVIILPIVGTFFFMFAILEDSGYLPRLAMLVDKVFKRFGLNGRGVIPFSLGFGCGTMAIMVTRTLETRRERIIATFLLSLAIPCSAQLGVILTLLSHSSLALTIWAVYMGMIFAIAGWLSGKIIPGKPSAFYMEIPPLRMPMLTNIVSKACIRMGWYFVEILPVFIITSIVMWCSDRSGLLTNVIQYTQPVMKVLGLPMEMMQVFLLGFFRRDYGAAGLYDLYASGSLTTGQLLIASVTLTLFVPCIAQVAVMIKEMGWLVSLLLVIMIVFVAVIAGWLLLCLLHLWQLQIY